MQHTSQETHSYVIAAQAALHGVREASLTRLAPLLLAALRAALLLIGLAGLAGCNSYHANFAQAYQLGQYQASEAQLRSEAGGALESEGNGDRLIYLLELGTVQRDLDQLDPSNQSFDLSDKYFAQVDQHADIRVGRVAKAVVTNPAELAYQGTGYDRIMMNVYKALNYMEQGNNNYARAELKRVAYTQQRIEQTKANKVKALQEEAKQSGNYNANALNDKGLQGQTRMLYGGVPENSIQNSYVNAFAEYLQGIFLLRTGDADDREVARAALRRTAGMVQNPYVQQDLDSIDQPDSQSITYVIFESGMAPMRQEIVINVPIWIYNLAIHDTGVDYVGVAFPKLVPIPGGMPYLQVIGQAGSYATRPIVDMDGVIAREFKDDLPAVITQTILASASKVALAYGANKMTQSTSWLNVLTRIATTAYQYAVNRADLRTWRTLPKTISIARLPTPASGQIPVQGPNGQLLATVSVSTGTTNVIWVRDPGNSSGVVCRTFQLKR